MFDISAVNRHKEKDIQQIIDQKTKPPGALGQLENLAKQLALVLVLGNNKIIINHPTMLIFAGDHGIAEEDVSIAPPAVTQQMVLNFLNGGAAINCFCESNKMAIEVIDAGILLPVHDVRLIVQSLGTGTKNFSKQPAMEKTAVEKGLKLGADVVNKHVASACNVIGFGEMGIANSSSAAAIMAAVLKLPVADCVGRGTGIDDTKLEKKIKLIEQATQLHKKNLNSPLNILASVGGFEIVQMVGAMLAAAEKKCILLIDGFIATSAALLACQINQNTRDYMVFCHQSNEQGHQFMLEHLQAKPLLSLELRLGEGTGAALALPLLRAAAAFYNNMASFESAGVEPKIN
ncbi:MAG: nicotinate-nucleotide--dimethylbenzimidazole phosphoribosyltransferase [gamma proteobacterium symbiont of Taylorina sp.]|nr:nicotinate-nucleotide--dimethylbenzimidazole phosphoribosyltransferase [gamma proteobacterium symbiont of Taylorina sp.]